MDEERYVVKAGKKLRTGYTTGSCAAGAAKAAAWMIKNQKEIDQITIDTPKGWVLNLQVHKPSFHEREASCCIIKDSGDDPDITNKMEVWATVRLKENGELSIQGGEGVGVVTQKGLQVPVGHAAINPVPLKMIEKEVRSIYGDSQGLEVVIHLPKGEELAKRTFNPKLGIVGGLSILGTTGIVEPMSEDALKDTITLELKILREKGFRSVVFTPGNIGEKLFISHFHRGDNLVKISNYLGHALEKCAELGFQRVILSGHMGKLIKPAGGIYYTHSRISSTRMEILTANLVLVGMKNEALVQVMNCRTTDEAMKIIEEAGKEEVYELIANKAQDNCNFYCFGEIQVGVALFSMTKLLAVSDSFHSILGGMENE